MGENKDQENLKKKKNKRFLFNYIYCTNLLDPETTMNILVLSIRTC